MFGWNQDKSSSYIHEPAQRRELKVKNKNLIGIYDFMPLHSAGGVSKFNRNITNCLVLLGYEIVFTSYYYGQDSIASKFDYIKRLINYFSGYRITAIFFKIWITVKKPNFCIVNFASMLRYCNGSESKFILVQHQSLDVLLGHRANLGLIGDVDILFKKLTKLIVLSESDKLDFLRLDKSLASKIFVLSHMVDVPIVNSKVIKPRRNIIMIARLDNTQKRFDLAIEIMKHLPEFTLSIYGDGKDRDLVRRLIAKSNLCNVSLFQYPNDLISVLDNADIHIMVSDYEGFGISNLEAAARGLPCVIRNTFTAAKILAMGSGLLDKNLTCSEIAANIQDIYENYEKYSEFSIELARSCSRASYNEKVKKLFSKI